MKRTPLKRKSTLKAKTPLKSYAKLKAYTKLTAKTELKKRTYKQTKTEKNRYSILTTDLEHCIICGKSPINLHEIFYGSNRLTSIKYGLVIPLCTCNHHKSNVEGIHKDKELDLIWKVKGQLSYMKHYNKTIEEFIKIFGRNYLS